MKKISLFFCIILMPKMFAYVDIKSDIKEDREQLYNAIINHDKVAAYKCLLNLMHKNISKQEKQKMLRLAKQARESTNSVTLTSNVKTLAILPCIACYLLSGYNALCAVEAYINNGRASHFMCNMIVNVVPAWHLARFLGKKFCEGLSNDNSANYHRSVEIEEKLAEFIKQKNNLK